MCRTTDGFEIARKDLELRGPGDFFGSRQHGLPDMKVANLMGDTRILYEAQNTARDILCGRIPITPEEKDMLNQETERLFGRISLN